MTAGTIALVILGLLPFIHPTIQTIYTVTDLTTSDLAHGFYRPQTDNAGGVFAWTETAASTTFPYVGTLPVQLHVELRSAAVAGGPDVPVRVLVAGTEVARLHPDPHRLDFQPFQLRVRPAPDHTLTVTFMSEAFHPTSGDRRILGTMLRSVAVERTDARASIAAWSWLYGALPVCLALIALAALGARRPSSSRAFATAAGYAAVVSSIVGTLAMLLALALLVHIGPIDRYRYAFWVEGTLFIAGFLAVVTAHLPLGDAGTPGLIARLSQVPIIMRQMRPLRRLRDALVLAVPAGIGWPLLGTWGTSDVRDKLDWMQNIASFGLVGGFRVSDNDYPPGTYVILAGVTRVAHRFMLDDLYAYKLSLLVFLMLTGIVFYLWTRNSAKAAILQLTLLVESVVLGYNDVYFLPFLLLALWALHARKWPWFGLLLGIACVIKWQPLIVAPVLLAACITISRDRRWLRNAAWFASTALVPVLVVLGTRAIFGDAFDRALTRGTSDSFLSANALNGYWIVTVLLRWLRPASLTLTDNPYKLYISIHAPLFMLCARALFLGTYGWIVVRWWRTARTFTATLYGAYLAYLAYCMVSLSVHENHLVLAVALAAVLWARDARYAALFLVTALSMNLNLLLFYGLDGASHAPNVTATLVLSGLNLALFVVLLVRGPFPVRVVTLPTRPSLAATAVERPAHSRP